MDASIVEAVEAIRANVKRCGLLQIWGSEVFRPGDLIYDVTGVTADGDHLRIHLRQPLDGSVELLDLDRPTRVKVKGGALKVGAAAGIRGFGRDWTPEGSSGPALSMS